MICKVAGCMPCDYMQCSERHPHSATVRCRRRGRGRDREGEGRDRKGRARLKARWPPAGTRHPHFRPWPPPDPQSRSLSASSAALRSTSRARSLQPSRPQRHQSSILPDPSPHSPLTCLSITHRASHLPPFRTDSDIRRRPSHSATLSSTYVYILYIYTDPVKSRTHFMRISVHARRHPSP